MTSSDKVNSYVADWLERQCESRHYFTAAQLHVCYRDRVVFDLAFGRDPNGSTIGPGSAFRTYCAAKPFLVAALDRSVARGFVALDAPIGRYVVGAHGALGEATVRDLCEHQLALADPGGFAAVTSPAEGRRARALAIANRARLSPEYSDFVAWEVLASVLEGANPGRSWRSLVREACEGFNAGRSEVVVDRPSFDRMASRGQLAANVSLRLGRFVPLLAEVAGSMWPRFDGPGFGLMCSARTLCTLVHHAFVIDGPDRHGRRAGVVPRFGPSGRPLEFRCGLMAGPTTLSVSDLWPQDLVGHSGLAGMTLVAGSRSLGITFSLHLNGMMSPATGDGYIRPLLTSALHGDLRGLGIVEAA